MKRKKLQSSGAHRSNITVILAGMIVSLLFSLLLSVLVATFVLNGSLREETVQPITFGIRMISVFAGTLIGGIVFKEKSLLQVVFTAVGYLLVLFGMGIVFYDGEVRNFLSGGISVLLGAVLSLVVLERTKNRRHKLSKFTP